MFLPVRRPQSSYVRSFRPKIKQPLRPKSSATILGSHDDSSSSTSSLKDGETKNDFDQITPNIIDKLGEGEDKDFKLSQPGPFDIVKEAEKPKAESDEDEGEESNSEEEEVDGDIDKDEEVVPKKSRGKDPVHSADEVFDESGYRIREPPDFDLPPEDLDVDDMRGRFSYHTSNMRRRKRQDSLPDALSHPWCHMDLLGLSESKDWRKEVRKVPEGMEEDVMDR